MGTSGMLPEGPGSGKRTSQTTRPWRGLSSSLPLGSLWVAGAASSWAVTTIAREGCIDRFDRVVLWALISSAYAVVLLLLTLSIRGVWALGEVIAGRRQILQRGIRHGDLAAMLFIGLLTANHLLTALGHKDTLTLELSPLVGLPFWVELSLVGLSVATPPVLWAASRSFRSLLQAAGRRQLVIWALASVSILLPPVFNPTTPVPPPRGALQVTDVAKPRPLVLVGLDGLDLKIVQAAVTAHRLEEVRSFLEQGYVGELDNEGYGFSPLVWNAVATGRRPEAHGIYGFVRQSSPLFRGPLETWWDAIPPSFGIKSLFCLLEMGDLYEVRPITGADRQTVSVWQVLSAAGYRTLTINYLQSLPAEVVKGQFLAWGIHESARTSFDGELPLGAEYPRGALKRLRPPPIQGGGLPVGSEARFLFEVTLHGLEEEPFNMVTVFSNWPDYFNHTLSPAELRRARAGDFSGHLTHQYLQLLKETNEFLRSVFSIYTDANVVVMSDHGVSTGFRFRQEILQHAYECPGVVLAKGPDVSSSAGNLKEAVSMYDMMPTVLSYFGVPLADDLEGQPRPRLLQPARPTKHLPTYEGLVPNDRVSADRLDFPEGMEERLRALGYLH